MQIKLKISVKLPRDSNANAIRLEASVKAKAKSNILLLNVELWNTQSQVTSTLGQVDGTASRHVRYLFMSLYTCGVIIIMAVFDRGDVAAICARQNRSD